MAQDETLSAATERREPLRVAVVGVGHRGVMYASYALKHPDEMKVTAVVDPNHARRDAFAKTHSIPAAHCFDSVEQLAAQAHVAQAAINATMDRLHVATSLPLLEVGLDVLLEKPIATSAQDVRTLLATASRCGRTVMVCHVLRYAPFYAEIRKVIASGTIGDLVSIETTEHVSYHHMATGFVRGKWNRVDRGGSSMLMAKCSHDLDLNCWFKSGIAPVRVSSFGGLMQYRPENAPSGSGTRCLRDCQIEATCPYSARKLYVEQNLWKFYAWETAEHLRAASDEQKLQSLATDNPYGRCVWRCDNDVVDHQAVIIQFADGATVSHTMIGGSAKASRSVHIIGTRGEIQGTLEDGKFTIRRGDPQAPGRFMEEEMDLDLKGDMHGGGDLRLVGDFVQTLGGGKKSISCTALEDSIYGALIGFAADESMTLHHPVDVRM